MRTREVQIPEHFYNTLCLSLLFQEHFQALIPAQLPWEKPPRPIFSGFLLLFFCPVLARDPTLWQGQAPVWQRVRVAELIRDKLVIAPIRSCTSLYLYLTMHQHLPVFIIYNIYRLWYISFTIFIIYNIYHLQHQQKWEDVAAESSAGWKLNSLSSGSNVISNCPVQHLNPMDESTGNSSWKTRMLQPEHYKEVWHGGTRGESLL